MKYASQVMLLDATYNHGDREAVRNTKCSFSLVVKLRLTSDLACAGFFSVELFDSLPEFWGYQQPSSTSNQENRTTWASSTIQTLMPRMVKKFQRLKQLQRHRNQHFKKLSIDQIRAKYG
jgi:hypothetical protein